MKFYGGVLGSRATIKNWFNFGGDLGLFKMSKWAQNTIIAEHYQIVVQVMIQNLWG